MGKLMCTCERAVERLCSLWLSAASCLCRSPVVHDNDIAITDQQPLPVDVVAVIVHICSLDSIVVQQSQRQKAVNDKITLNAIQWDKWSICFCKYCKKFIRSMNPIQHTFYLPVDEHENMSL